jgi:RNA polymerase sigma-70 factor (ECF subfamily)
VAEQETAARYATATYVAADWEAAYRDNLDWVYRFIYGRLGNRSDAEDVTAEVFLRALPRLKLGAPASQLRAYLTMTARSALADHWRKTYDLELTPGGDYDVAQAPDPGAAHVDNGRRANRLLARLPEQYRRVLELRFLQGYSVRETAAALAISVANAKVLQHRALRRAAELGTEDLW